MKCIIYGLSLFNRQVECYLKENKDIIGHIDIFSEWDYI